jgi:hypothetical protein
MTHFLRFCTAAACGLLLAAQTTWGAEDGPELETTKYEPVLVYRAVSIQGQNKSSIFHKGKTSHDYVDQLYARLRMEKTYNFTHEVVIEPTIRTNRTNPETMEFLFEQAYVHTELGKNVFLTGGKKAEFDGSGFFVNPSDLLNEDKDLFDTLYQYEGKVFSRVSWQHDGRSLAVGYIPKAKVEADKGKIWTKATAEIAETDVRLQHTFNKEDLSTFGLSLSRFFGERFELHWDGRYQLRQRTDTAKFSERLYSTSYLQDDPSGYYLGGTRYSLPGRRTLIVEAIQQQSGLDNQELGGDPQDPAGEVRTWYSDNLSAQQTGSPNNPSSHIIGRRYVFVGFKDEGTFETIKLGLYALTNVMDASNYGQASILYNISPLTSIELQPIWFAGRPRTEFGERPTTRIVAINLRGKF